MNPTNILETGFGFWKSKVLLTAVEMGVFTALSDGPRTGQELGDMIGLHPRGIHDFLDSLVAMKFLDRSGLGESGQYSNSAEAEHFLSEKSPRYIGGILVMLNARLFRFWDALPEALRTGQPQNEIKHSKKGVFEELYADAPRLEQFLGGMAGISRINFEAFARKFDFSGIRSMCDVGGASGLLCIECARVHPDIQYTTFDLPPVEAIARRQIAAAGFEGTIRPVSGDFFKDPLPRADLITMGLILHDWNLKRKKQLIRAVWEALEPGGTFVVIEHLIDDERRENLQGLLMSLNMLIENGDAFDYTGAQFREWCLEAGFTEVEIMPLAGPVSAGIARK